MQGVLDDPDLGQQILQVGEGGARTSGPSFPVDPDQAEVSGESLRAFPGVGQSAMEVTTHVDAGSSRIMDRA